MIATAELVVYKTIDNNFSFREIIRDQDGDICGVSPFDAAPEGNTLEDLAEDLKMFIKTLLKPVVDENDLEFEGDPLEIEVFTDQGEGHVH